MGFNDLNRFVWPAMSGVDALFLYGDTFDWKPGPNNYIIGGSSQLLLFCYEDLMPWRTASKVFRLGRDGPGIDGESAGHEGAGDLTAGMVNQEPPNILTDGRFPTEKYRGSSWSYNYASGGYSTVYSDGTYNNCTSAGWRGHERPRIYGPKDYHRLMAFGVPVFQIDWTDGRRDQDRRLIYSPEYMPWTNVSIPAMHTNGDLERCYQWKFGPGPPIDYCWNFHSPEHVRNMNLKITRGVSPEAHVGPQNGPDCGPWGQGGSDYYGMSGWARPKALRVRLMIADPSTDPPQAYEFSETYTLLAQ
jgi:hypothetical protein